MNVNKSNYLVNSSEASETYLYSWLLRFLLNLLKQCTFYINVLRDNSYLSGLW